MNTILFVDDDPYWSRRYQAELQEKYSLVYKASADGAIAELSVNESINVLVLDIMMDTPDSVDETATDGGLMTGVWILDRLKIRLVQKRMPVIILTNRQKNVVVEAVDALNFPQGQVVIFTKAEMSAKQLPLEIQRHI